MSLSINMHHIHMIIYQYGNINHYNDVSIGELMKYNKTSLISSSKLLSLEWDINYAPVKRITLKLSLFINPFIVSTSILKIKSIKVYIQNYLCTGYLIYIEPCYLQYMCVYQSICTHYILLQLQKTFNKRKYNIHIRQVLLAVHIF